MYLGPEGVRKFFNTWLPLLRFVNERYEIVPNIPREDDPKRWTPGDASPIRTKLWEDPSIIADYIRERGHRLPDSDVRILSGWQRPVKGNFIAVKHLKNYTVFMNDDRLYGVLGISNPIEEMLPPSPNYVKTVLLPFDGKIIYDSLIDPYPLQLGPGARAGITDQYRSMKQRLGILVSLDDQ